MQEYARQIGFEAENAGCDRAGAAIVRGVTFSLKPGEALQLFGPNGSGKSSLLSMFAGLFAPVEGALTWASGGARSPTPFENSIFFMGHESSVKPSLTALENLEFWARIYGAAKEGVREALCTVGGDDFSGLRASRLSAGQRRRLELARSVLANRPVWLLDEPAAAIDGAGVEIIRQLTDGHRRRGGISIIATHDDLGGGFKRLELGR